MKYITALIITMSSSLAMAGPMTAQKLQNDLNGPDSVMQAHAMGYILGAADAMSGAVVCTPSGTKSRKIAESVLRWLDRNQANIKDISADEAVFAALSREWPCRPSRSQSQPMT